MPTDKKLKGLTCVEQVGNSSWRKYSCGKPAKGYLKKRRSKKINITKVK